MALRQWHPGHGVRRGLGKWHVGNKRRVFLRMYLFGVGWGGHGPPGVPMAVGAWLRPWEEACSL